MVELENELVEQLNGLGVPLEGLPAGAKPLSMNNYYAFDIKDRRIIFEPVDGYYKVRSIIPVPQD